MSETASQLLATFETLPADEQHEVLIALLRRSGGITDTSLTDEQLTAVADELFQGLDAKEADVKDDTR